jgi:hypothetical protein
VLLPDAVSCVVSDWHKHSVPHTKLVHVLLALALVLEYAAQHVLQFVVVVVTLAY